ncbi:MAG: hypothetical protein HY908_27820 [Myxococcales bacterium]|nr:hypothetical protein [Myxococcales bacterium]
MKIFLSGNVWAKLGPLAAKARRKRAALAYVSSGSPIRFRRGDVLITDASDGCIRAGQTSAPFLARAVRAGVEVRSHKHLHAKVLVLDDQVAVGSANASQGSGSLMEAAALISDAAVLRDVDSWFDALARSSVRVDQVFLQRICAIPVVRAGGAPGRSQASLLEAVRRRDAVLRDIVFVALRRKPG